MWVRIVKPLLWICSYAAYIISILTIVKVLPKVCNWVVLGFLIVYLVVYYGLYKRYIRRKILYVLNASDANYFRNACYISWIVIIAGIMSWILQVI